MACNYDANATDDDGSCTYADANYDCNGNCINDADSDGICDELEISGCTDDTACNYDANATDDDGSCTYADANYDCNGNCINDADFDGVCDEQDNCINESNFDQLDSDNDGEGDVCDYDDGIGIEEITDETPVLIKMIDVLGKEQKEHTKGVLLFYIYDNGTTKKIMK